MNKLVSAFREFSVWAKENDDYAGNWMMTEWDEGREEVHLTSTKGVHVQKQEREIIRFVF